MKTINKIMLLLAAAVFTFTACEQETKRDPSPVAPADAAAFKLSAVEVDINPMKSELAYDVAVVRSNTAEELTVTIEVVEGDADVINVPATASFAKEVAETSLKLTFPTAQLDSTYSIVIAIKNENQSPYIDGASTFSFTVNIASWEAAAAPAIFVDGVVCSPFGMDPIAWYVQYQEKSNSDGSKDFRFINPYRENKGSDEPDNFGVYSWFVHNSGETVDKSKDYNFEIHVNADNTATFAMTYLGPDYGYGPALIWMVADFYAQKQGTDPDYAQYGIGVYDPTDESITFPAGSYLWYFDGYGGNLASLPEIIYLNSKAYQDDHLSIADYNDPSIEWEEVESVVNLFESTIFNFSDDTQKLFKAVDQYEGNPKSPFVNLYGLKDVYAEGEVLAFYWDGNDGAITIPAEQDMKLSFMKQNLIIAEGTGSVATSDVKGTAVKIFSFDLVIVSDEGNAVGEFVETFSMAEDAIIFSKEDFIGDFTMSGYSQFDGSAASFAVTIDSALVISGFQYCSGVQAEFNDETGTLLVAPQAQDSLYGQYDIAFYTTDANGPSTTSVLEFGFGLSGVAKLTATSEADGYLVRSEAAGGWLAGHYDLTLTPGAPAAVPAKTPAFGAQNLMKRAFKAANVPSVEHLSFKGKYQRSLRAEVAF